MSDDKERAAFEKSTNSRDFGKLYNGEYGSPWLQRGWEGWLARAEYERTRQAALAVEGRGEVERVAIAMMNATAPMPRLDPSREFPILCLDPDFNELPADLSEALEDDNITQEAVLRLAQAAIAAIKDI